MPEFTEADLARMSPDELRELQRQQCIFCHIISGKVPARKVYEDDVCVAILDINPAALGHVLLLPKDHVSILPQLRDDALGHIGMVSKHLCGALVKSLKVDGVSVFAANGVAAGQRAAHVFFHLIPRKDGDGVGLGLHERQISDEELHVLQNKVISAVRKVFEIPEDESIFDSGRQSSPEVVLSGASGEKPKSAAEKEFDADSGAKSSLDDIADLLLRGKK